MNAIQEITNILKAMGANPVPVSNTEIKINAPTIGGNGGNNEKTENKKARRRVSSIYK